MTLMRDPDSSAIITEDEYLTRCALLVQKLDAIPLSRLTVGDLRYIRSWQEQGAVMWSYVTYRHVKKFVAEKTEGF